MVKYYDDSGVFHGTRDDVWSLVEAHTDENVPRMHPPLVKVTTKSDEGDVVEREVQVEAPDGERETMLLRFTACPPHSLTIDYLSGSMKGTWVTNAYIPEEEGTRVICTGEFHVQGLDDASALRMGSDMLDARFEEDAHFLDEMKSKAKPEEAREAMPSEH